MSKKIFINNLDTTVPEAIFSALRTPLDEEGKVPDDANIIYGSYISKDSSLKPDGVFKMLKVSARALLTVTHSSALETPSLQQVHQQVRSDSVRPPRRQPP